MPSLIQSLHASDLGHLRIVAGLWGVEALPNENEAAIKKLEEVVLEQGLVKEMVDALSVDSQAALKEMAEAGGKIPWVAFERKYGEIRVAGPGRRDREQLHLNPINVSEVLYYRAFLARAFFDSAKGAQEYAYIPDDLLKLVNHEVHEVSTGEEKIIQMPTEKDISILGRPALAKEYEHILPASDRILDDATTLLAALRMGIEAPETPVPPPVIVELLKAARILAGEKAQPEQVKEILEQPRLEALNRLRLAWRASSSFNELHLLPGLACEGEWTNQPLATRDFILRLLEALPEGKWWSLQSFIQTIKEKQPDFQRPAGDYDSWFIRRLSDGNYLRGFSSWDEVEGALLKYYVTGPMFWLGMVNLATSEGSDTLTAFQIKPKEEAQRVGLRTSTADKAEKLTVSSRGRITIPRMTPRAVRYQIARFCDWDEAKPEEYCYHVTTNSLQKAEQQGLKAGQLLSLLARNAASDIPPAFVKALKRWEHNGTEARLEVRTILRVKAPEILDELRKSKARRFLEESLGPVTVIIKAGAGPQVLAALAELGLLAEVSLEN